MPTMTDVRSVAANTTIANVLQGKTNEFLPANSLVRVGVNASAVGLFSSVLIQEKVILEDQEVSSQNRIPIDPDDIILEEIGLAGDRIIVKVRNSTGVAITAQTLVKTTDVG